MSRTQVAKYGVPDFRTPEQRSADEALAPVVKAVNERMSAALDAALNDVTRPPLTDG